MKPSFTHSLSFGRSVRRIGQVSLIAVGFSGLLASASPLLADISVNLRVDAPPPPPRQEVVIESTRPSPDHVWVAGYWDGAPGHYTWAAGHWDRPPQHGARWEAPHWEKDHDGHYVQVKGGWRN